MSSGRESIGKMRGQTSLEFMVLLAIGVLTVIVGVILLSGQISTVNSLKDQNDARNAVLDLSAASKEVYAQGEGSRKQVYVQLPSNYEAENSSVGNLTIWIRAGGSDYVSVEDFTVRGKLPSTSGAHWVWVTSEGSWVRIGDQMMDLDRMRIYLVMESNSTDTQSFSLKNVWKSNITVSTTTTWTTTDVNISGVPSSFQLAPNETMGVDVFFAAGPIPDSIYHGEIELEADDGQGSTDQSNILITVVVMAPGVALPTEDLEGPIITNIYQNPSPVYKFEPLTIFVETSDQLTGNSTISGCEIDLDSAGNWSTMLPVDGAYNGVVETAARNYTSGLSLGPHVVAARCTDYQNNTGPTAYYYLNISEADQEGPIVIEMYQSEYPTTLSNVTVGAIATDEYTGDSIVSGCAVKLDNGSWNLVTPVDGIWNSTRENFTYNAGILDVGQHYIYYQCNDSLGNVGEIYNDSITLIDVDLMLVLDRSGSMRRNVTNANDDDTEWASSTGWSWEKDLDVDDKNGDNATLITELRASQSGCTAYYRATIDGQEVANGSITSTSYTYLIEQIDISSFYPPYEVDLWLRRDQSGCRAYNRDFSLQQPPTKIYATQESAKTFLDVAGSELQAGLVSFASSASKDRNLALMDASNKAALKSEIDSLTPDGYTCIQCGLEEAADELTSGRARPGASKVIVFLTDGQANEGDTIDGAVYCRDRNITVYTIGFGTDVDEVELTNLALLTNGEYYFAPNAETLLYIFRNIGK